MKITLLSTIPERGISRSDSTDKVEKGNQHDGGGVDLCAAGPSIPASGLLDWFHFLGLNFERY